MGRVKENTRQKYIDTIMKNKYGNDDPDSQNRAFHESLSLDELARLADEDNMFNEEFGDEFELDGEVRDFDFSDEELNGKL